MHMQRNHWVRSVPGRAIAATAIGIAALSLGLSGCSGGSVTGNTGGGGATAITVWSSYTGPNATVAQELVDEFNDSQDDYDVTLQFAAGQNEFTPKLVNAIKNGAGPNAVLGDTTPQNISTVAETGKVLPLSPLLDDSDVLSKDDFTGALLSTGTVDGELYAIPTDAGDYAIVYNKQLFAEAGITDTPTTWAELADVAEQLTNGSTQYGIYLPSLNGEWAVFTWQSTLWSAGGEFLSEDNTEVEFDSPEGVEALTAWTDMVKNGSAFPQTLETTSDTQASAALTSGRVAMQFNGAYNLPILDEALGAENVGVFELPSIKEKAANLGSNSSYILEGTEEQEAGAWAFLEYWLQPEVQAEWDTRTGFLPTNSRTADTEIWTDYLEKNPRIEPFAAALEYAKARPSIAQYGSVSKALSEQLSAAMLGKATPEEALKVAAETAQEALDNG